MNTPDFYTLAQCNKIFSNIINSQWRIFKSIDEDGICRQNKFQITSPKRLYKFIHQCKNPQKLYISVSTFLNPQSNKGNFSQQKYIYQNGYYSYPRAGYIYADCILLDSQFFIDIDDDNLRVAQEDTRKIIKYMHNQKDYTLHMLQFSGGHGFHLIYNDVKRRRIKDPLRRIKYYHNKKSRLVKKIMKLDLKTIDKNHENIMTDVFRVYALPYSIKGNNGKIVTPIPEDTFMQEDICAILRSKRLTAFLERSSKASEENISDESQVATHLYQVKERASLISPLSNSSPIYFRFVDNMVNGLNNNYITVLKFNQMRFNINHLKELQRLYNLSDFYIHSIGRYIYAYNFKCLQFKRLVKVMRRAKSTNMRYFLTRRHLPIQLSNSRYENGEIADNIKFIGILKSEYGLEHYHSLPHCKLFGLEYKNMVGKEWSNEEPCHIGEMRVR